MTRATHPEAVRPETVRPETVRPDTVRPRRLVAMAVTAVAGFAIAACTPPPTPAPATYTEGPCPDATGLTVVADFSVDLSDEIVVRCALGPQASGIEALGNIGLEVNTNAPDAVPGTVCTLEGLPTEGYPYCWSTGGFWSYWVVDENDEWGFSSKGPGDGPLEEGSVIGFAWAQGFSTDGPRVATDGTPLVAG